MTNELNKRFGTVLKELANLEKEQHLHVAQLLCEMWDQTIQQAGTKTDEERSEYFIAALEFQVMAKKADL